MKMKNHRFTLTVIGNFKSPGIEKTIKNIAADSKEEACEKVRAKYGKNPGILGVVACRKTS